MTHDQGSQIRAVHRGIPSSMLHSKPKVPASAATNSTVAVPPLGANGPVSIFKSRTPRP